ncbi:hypothetical protein ONE63_005258 [Megalurothrips usitatus]|uniref:Transcription termination factor 3, mitochondrial n=1 Tax=Megalurothrips usitatus TaxID=439358 RepID=A0AAV7XVF7_9NEOP|nr:hypothetical protein ONE63_005258 [Megalurothrips usitatus]
MLRSVLLRRACAWPTRVGARCARPASKVLADTRLQVQTHQLRWMSKSLKSKNPKETALPKPPLLSTEEEDFLEDVVREELSLSPGSVGGSDEFNSGLTSGALPEAPEMSLPELPDLECDEADEEPVEDVDPVPFIPPVQKFCKISSSKDFLNTKLLASSESSDLSATGGPSPPLGLAGLNIDPSLEPVLEAWARAIAPTPAAGPMPLHELANRSTKIKELVKLGVDFSVIVQRHGDLERLLHRNWEDCIKPQIRFLVDCGINPDFLGTLFTRNTPILWTDKDDIQVRLNYMQAKLFTKDQIKKIINKAPFWLTLPTKELDSRLGFVQRTFKLSGSDVRLVASSYPTVISSPKWTNFVDTTKLMDRELGFCASEQKKLLFTNPQCFLRPSLLRKAFQLCHNEIGLSHTQLANHAALLVNRVNRMKPRHDFLKFLKRNIFDVENPLYLSPDWLWQGTTEEFCEKAAKATVDEYENFLKLSML